MLLLDVSVVRGRKETIGVPRRECGEGETKETIGVLGCECGEGEREE